MPRKEEYWANPEKHKKANREYAKLHPEKVKEGQKRFYEKHPEKRKEYRIRYKGRYKGRYNEYQREYYLKNRERLLKLGRINYLAHQNIPLSLKCDNCGSTENLDRHHQDYSKPLEVRTLCRSCHKKEHYINQPSF